MSDKAERRQARLLAEREREKKEALTTPRHPHDQAWGYSGVGSLVLQLIRRPSFEPSVCYEIRGGMGALMLFRSQSRSPDDELVVGHEVVDVRPSDLYRLLMLIDAISIPVRVRAENVGVLDGVTYEVTAFGGIQAIARFSWPAGSAPAAWTALVSLVESTIDHFNSASRITGQLIDAR